MSTFSGPQRTAKSSSRHTKPLKRGKACMNCRFLKIKCDGVKPVCGPCEAHPRDDECEYADGTGRSRTRQLEDHVQRLEARLQELENPDSSSPSVTLYDPYGGYKEQRASRSPPLLIIDSPSAYSPLSPFSPTSATSSLPSGRHWQPFSALAANAESTGSSGSSSKSPLRRTTLPPPIPTPVSEDPSLRSIQAALDGFLPHAGQFGFFLHVPTFRNAALLALPSGHHSLPTPGLLTTVRLMASNLSQSEHEHELNLLRQAVGSVMVDLTTTHPYKVVHTLQAKILLVYYFLRTGALLEAKVHLGGAVALALGSGLHKIRSVNAVAPSAIALVHDQPHSLSPPSTTLEEAERINGFWTLYCLHKLFSVALEQPSHVCGALEAPGILIDTPWPIDMDDFSEASIPPELQGDATVRAFLNSATTQGPWSQLPTSSFGQMTKAATLFHRAAHLAGQYNPALLPRDAAAYYTAARNISNLIDQFRASLPPLPPTQGGISDAANRTLLLTHSLVDAAAIKLHWIFAYAYPTSKQTCITAARNLVALYGDISLQDLSHVNPIMGNLWLTAGLVFVDEISRMRQLSASFPGAVVDEEELMECYRSTLKVMSQYSQDCVLMRYHLTKVQMAFEAI